MTMANACVRIAVAAVIGLLLVGCNGEDEGGGQTDASVDTETGVSDHAADSVDISTSDAGDAEIGRASCRERVLCVV